MNLGYAVTYVFDDRKWFQKIAILIFFTVLASLAIVGVGIPALVLVLGYMLRIARNVRNGLPRPLPEWDHWGDMFKDGGYLALAMTLYNLPLLVIVLFIWTVGTGMIATVLDAGQSLFASCCIVPIFFIYAAVVWPLLATAITEYMETNEVGAMYRFVHLWDVMLANIRIVRQWALYAIIVNVVVSILMVIPLLGWFIVAMFVIVVHGHLLGQFAHQLSITNKPVTHKKAAKKR